MKVLLTGGSGNLGQTLVSMLLDHGDTPVILDVRAPRDLKKGALFIEGSILDRSKLTDILRACDCIVHIAAWHGIHKSRGEKNSHDFFDPECARHLRRRLHSRAAGGSQPRYPRRASAERRRGVRPSSSS